MFSTIGVLPLEELHNETECYIQTGYVQFSMVKELYLNRKSVAYGVTIVESTYVFCARAMSGGHDLSYNARLMALHAWSK